MQPYRPTVSAIIPAYNEAGRLSSVLKTLTTYPGFYEVIVVNDGSQDSTKEEALAFPVRYFEHPVNRGKGYAMDTGVRHARGDVIFFSDADIHGLNAGIISAILAPVLADQAGMSVGVCWRPLYLLPLSRYYTLLLGGQRALRRELWYLVPDFYKRRFRIEVALNYTARRHSRGIHQLILPYLGQTIKEKKLGLWAGIRARWRMTRDIVAALWHLYIIRRPLPMPPQKNPALLPSKLD